MYVYYTLPIAYYRTESEPRDHAAADQPAAAAVGPGEGGEPQKIIQSPDRLYKAPKRLYKAPESLYKDPTYQTKPINIRQILK